MKLKRVAPSGLQGLRPGLSPGRNLPGSAVSSWLNYYSGFSPLSLTPALWLDASDTASITGASSVTQWNDKSGNANHGTAAGANSPTTNATTRNGLNVIDFNGTNSVALTSTITLNATWAIAAVAVKAGVANKSVLIVGLTPFTTYLTFPLSSSGGQPYLGTDNGSPQTTLGPSVTVTNWTSIIANVAATGAGGAWVYTDGVAGTAGNGGNAGQTLKSVGAYSPSTYSLQGSLAELIVVNRSLTASELVSLQAYLKAKWATT